jgi:hypothetical protein
MRNIALCHHLHRDLHRSRRAAKREPRLAESRSFGLRGLAGAGVRMEHIKNEAAGESSRTGHKSMIFQSCDTRSRCRIDQTILLSRTHAEASPVSRFGGQTGRTLTRGQRMAIWLSTIGLASLLCAGYFAYGGAGAGMVLGAVLLVVALAIWIDRTA